MNVYGFSVSLTCLPRVALCPGATLCVVTFPCPVMVTSNPARVIR